MNATEKSLKQLAKGVGIKCEFGVKLDYDKQDEWQQQSDGWHCTLRYKGRQYSFDFWKGIGHHGSEPTVDDCLDALLSDSAGADNTFEDFCGEFGYDTDSRKAERIYKQCQKVRENMERLLGEDFEAFLYADR
jgi:hypothetical protein